MAVLFWNGTASASNASSVVPLTAARTVYVDSATGNDLNSGAQATPFATLARAWAERKRYSELRAQFTIQLIGVGPYTLPFMSNSLVDTMSGGLFVLRGDTAAEIVQSTGTATGDISGFVIPTSAGVGSTNTRKGDFLRMTSGNCAGASFLIGANTDTTVTVSNKRARATAGAIANNDTWQIIRPGTVVQMPTVAFGGLGAGFYDFVGGVANGASAAGHILYNIEFTLASGSTGMRVVRSMLQFVQCRNTGGLFCLTGNLRMGLLANAFPLGVGTNGTTDLLYGAGTSVATQFSISDDGACSGVVSWSATLTLGSSGPSVNFQWVGGTADAATTINTGAVLTPFGATNDNRIVNNTITIRYGGMATINSASWVFAVTSGSCWRVKDGAQLVVTAAMTGGTSDAAGYGVDVRGGGRCFFVAVTPALTGGTAGSDLRTTATAVAANAALNADNTSVDALGSPFAEALCRVTAA